MPSYFLESSSRSIMKTPHRFVAFLLLAALGTFLANVPSDNAGAADQPPTTQPTTLADLDRQILERAGVTPSRESIENFFTDHQRELARAAELITQWQHDQFQIRQQATDELIAMPAVPRPLLEAAQHHHDPEVRWRASEMLRMSSSKPDLASFPNEDACRALLRMMREHQLSDCGDILVRVAEAHNKFEIHYLASNVLAEIATDNETLVRELLTHDQNWRRALALKAGVENNLVAAEFDMDELIAADKSASVQLLVALTLVSRGDHRSLDMLVMLLDENTPAQERSYALQVLRTVCDHPDLNGDAEEWRTWLADQGDSLTLNVPFELKMNSFETFLARVQVFSSGFSRGNSCGIFYDGRQLVGREGVVPDHRGINVLAMYGEEILLVGSYDVYQSEAASDVFAGHIDALPEGTMVVVAACDAISTGWNANAQRALGSIGGETTLAGRHRLAYFCIGRKGMSAGEAIETIDPGEGPIFYPESFAEEIEVWTNTNIEARVEARVRIVRGQREEVPW